jgi:hypothetical protein
MSNNEYGGFARKFMQDHEGMDVPQRVWTRERQLTAEALNLRVDWIDGRRSEGFCWRHYAGFEWVDLSDEERLVIHFDPRFVEILGKNLSCLLDEIAEGRLNRIRELSGAQRKQLEQHNPENEPVIRAINVYPRFQALLEEIKGEENERHTRNTERAYRRGIAHGHRPRGAAAQGA